MDTWVPECGGRCAENSIGTRAVTSVGGLKRAMFASAVSPLLGSGRPVYLNLSYGMEVMTGYNVFYMLFDGHHLS